VSPESTEWRITNFPSVKSLIKEFSLHFGQAPVQKYIDELLDWVASRKIKLNDIIPHRLPIEEAPQAYDIFKNKEEDCVKVVLKP
jgi:S-(hydroxymethyl)glutathione dehydrogenase / alcohol dehydrogenase